MAPAGSALREAAAGITAANPAMMLLSNLDGAVVTSGTDWLERIIAQVSAPVRWQECMRTMAGEGAAAFVELLPGGTLTGLARRALPGVATVALKTPDDLAAARSLIAEHGAPDPDENGHRPEWRLLVAPQDGTFRAAQAGHPGQALTAGAAVASGAALGHVEVRSGQHAIAPAFAGTIIEWLVEDGDPVNAGQPLVRLQPEGAE
jgi:[acyl-carrier-protein] S-malonyltransferase